METTVAAAHLVLSGVMERHPGLRVLLAHARRRGPRAPRPAAPRLGGDRAGARPAERAARGLAAPASSTTRSRTTPGCVRELVAFAGADHVLLGSDHPFDMADPRPAATVAAAGLEPRGRAPRPGRERGAAPRTGGDAMTTVDVVVAGAGHNSLITAAYLAQAGYEVARARRAPDPGRRGGERGAAAARLPGRLVLDRPHAHPDQPAAARRRARAAGRLRPRVPRARPVRARRVPGRAPPDDVDGRRAQLRGDRPLLARRRRRLPPRARRVRRGQAHLRRGDVHAAGHRARRSSSGSPSTRADACGSAGG